MHRFVNELEHPIGIYLYGRRMYEVMVAWERPEEFRRPSPRPSREFAEIWGAADKVVYSRTLDAVSSARTAARARLRSRGRPSDEGGLRSRPQRRRRRAAAAALEADLVDECQLLAVPEIIGGGTNWLPGGVRASLELLDHRSFDGGTVYSRYRVAEYL